MTEHLLQGGGVFEITDHTTASDWERFVASLEEILTDWNLHKCSNKTGHYIPLPDGFISKGLWHEKHEILKLGSVTLDLRYQYIDDSKLKVSEPEFENDAPGEPRSVVNEENEHNEEQETQMPDLNVPKAKEKEYGEYELPDELPECLRDLDESKNDFASRAHCLVRWYNLRKFLILSPRGDTIVSEDKVRLVLSSASIALANIDCHIPIYVQIHNPKNHFYQGISEHNNIRTMYEMVFFKQYIKQYSYLSDLISMFREKTSCNLNDPITASIRLNYCLKSFELFLDPSEVFTGNEHLDEEQDELVRMTSRKKDVTKRSIPDIQDMGSDATFLQVCEALKDCVPHSYKILEYIHVAAIWPPVSDKVITDSQVHSDLDPSEAPIWTMRCVTSDNCNMKLLHITQVVYELLGSAIDFAYDKLDASQAFKQFNRETLKERCLKLSYELATHPEVAFSHSPSDDLRKLIALLFYRANELYSDQEPLNQIAGHLRKKPSMNEIYRELKKQRPSVKEFLIRGRVSRPMIPISAPALPQRMFCTICDEEFRLCGAFSELCN